MGLKYNTRDARGRACKKSALTAENGTTSGRGMRDAVEDFLVPRASPVVRRLL